MLSCKEATHLMSESQERTLSVREKVQLKMHLALCKGCSHVSDQMAFIRRACKGYLQRKGFKDDV